MIVTATVKETETQRGFEWFQVTQWVRAEPDQYPGLQSWGGEYDHSLSEWGPTWEPNPGGHFSFRKIMVEVRIEPERWHEEKQVGPAGPRPPGPGNLQGGYKAAQSRGSHCGRWASSRPSQAGLAPTLVGLVVPALTRQPACQLGKLN